MPDILRAYLVTTICGWSLFPLLRRALARFPDQGYSVSRSFGLVVSAWLAWMATGAIGHPLSQALALGAILVVGAACAMIGLWCRQRSGPSPEGMALPRRDSQPPLWRLILLVEILFVSGLLLFAWIERPNPAVDPGRERFIDYAILRAGLGRPGL